MPERGAGRQPIQTYLVWISRYLTISRQPVQQQTSENWCSAL